MINRLYKTKFALALLATLSISSQGAYALSAAENDQKTAVLKSDVVLSAMQDELDRSMKSLKLPNYPLPYFASVQVVDEDYTRIAAVFGSLENNDHSINRTADVTLRVGDKKLDNTAAGGNGSMALGSFFMGGGGGSSLVTDDDYDALRYGLWMQSDHTYKHAVESLESAKAKLSNLNIEDRPDCFSAAEAVVDVQDPAKNQIEATQWAKRIEQLSAVVKKYPLVQSSRFYMNIRVRTRRFINSEGTLTRTASAGYLIGMSATAECKDGMNVSDYDYVGADTQDNLPDQDQLESKAHELCKRVTELAQAKRAEHYSGPVLFEKESAAELAVSVIPPLVTAKRPTLSLTSDEDQTLGKPVVNASISVVDDAPIKTFNGLPLKGGWTIDYEGVKADRLSLIENGVLKTVCSTRTPSRVLAVSNGHSRGAYPTPSHLFLSTKDKLSLSDLRAKLITMGKEQSLSEVIVVRRSIPAFLNASGSRLAGLFTMMGGSGASVGRPSLVYKIDVATGKEELIRGARFSSLPKRGLMELQLASDDAAPYTVGMPADESATTLSLVTPSILVKELEISKPSRTTELAPYLKNPFFEEKGQ